MEQKKIPVIVGSVFGEFDFKPVLENRDELTREETMKLLEKCFQEDAEEIAAEFEKAYPNNRLVDVLSLDYIFRYASKDFIAKKSVHKEAPVYSYMFNYEFPYEEENWHGIALKSRLFSIILTEFLSAMCREKQTACRREYVVPG